MSLYLGNTPIAQGVKEGASWEIGDIGIAALGIDETKNKRRYLNGQVISQTQFAEFATKVKNTIVLYPSLGATEVNWQAEVTNSDLGQCGKFVVDDNAGTIRLPKVVNINGLQDLSYLGAVKEAGLPNITATGGSRVNGNTITGAYYVGTYSNMSGGSWTTSNDSLCFDASRSNSIYGNNTTVQQEAVQYPYFIQVATGVEEDVDISTEIQLNNPFYLGQSMYSSTEPNNASWLKSNGQWNSGSVYASFYNWLLGIYNGTITGTGVSVKAVGDGTITEYDFVLDTANTQFKLPTLNGEEDLLGNSYESITYTGHDSVYIAPKNGFYSINGYGSTANIWLANTTTGIWITTAGKTSQSEEGGCFIEAKKGDEIHAGYYGGTIRYFKFTPSIGNGSLYFYVGETVQDANVIAAGQALTDIANLKAHYITETYINGTSWYRVYSDGWCIQGGEIPTSTTTANFLKPYSGLPLYWGLTNIDTGGNASGATATSTGLTFESYSVANRKWIAMGYIS